MAKRMNPLLAIMFTPSEKLAVITGKGKLNRPQAVKKVWAYIKAKKLQDKKNKRMINADEKLQPLFGKKKQISMFELAKVVSANLK